MYRRRRDPLRIKLDSLRLSIVPDERYTGNGGRVPNVNTKAEHYVFIVASFCMFTFFFAIKWLFLDLVKAGYSLAFE